MITKLSDYIVEQDFKNLYTLVDKVFGKKIDESTIGGVADFMQKAARVAGKASEIAGKAQSVMQNPMNLLGMLKPSGVMSEEDFKTFAEKYMDIYHSLPADITTKYKQDFDGINNIVMKYAKKFDIDVDIRETPTERNARRKAEAAEAAQAQKVLRSNRLMKGRFAKVAGTPQAGRAMTDDEDYNV